MNKKFLSAILFGALMITSTGTFVSCKDYDDDINDLQSQVDTNVSAVDALKTQLASLQSAAAAAQAAADAAKAAGDQAKAAAEQAKADAIKAAEDKVAALKTLVEANYLTEAEVEAAMAVLSGQIDAIEDGLSTLTGKVDKNIADIAAIKADLEEQKAALEALQEGAAYEDILVMIESLQSQLNTVTGSVWTLIEDVDMLATGMQENLAELANRLSDQIAKTNEFLDAELEAIRAEIFGEGPNTIMSLIGSLASQIEGINADILTLQSYGSIKSLAFIPEVIEDHGLGVIEFYSLQLKNVYVTNTPTATYRVNPKNADQAEYEWSFINRVVKTRAAGDLNNLLTITKSEDKKDSRMFWLQANQDVLKDLDQDELPLVALKATKGEAEIVSDYATVKFNVLKEFGLAQLDADSAFVKYFSETIPTEHDTTLLYTGELSLYPIVEAWSKEMKEALADLKVEGIEYSIEKIEKYLGADGVTDQQKFVTFNNGIVKVDNEWLEKGTAAIGRTPVFKATATVNGIEIASAYIKVKIVDKAYVAPENQKDLVINVNLGDIEYTEIVGDTTFNFDWARANQEVYDVLGLTKEAFVQKYKHAPNTTLPTGVKESANTDPSNASTETAMASITIDNTVEFGNDTVAVTFGANVNTEYPHVVIKFGYNIVHTKTLPALNPDYLIDTNIIQVKGRMEGNSWKLISDMKEHFVNYLAEYKLPNNHKSFYFRLKETPAQTGAVISKGNYTNQTIKLTTPFTAEETSRDYAVQAVVTLVNDEECVLDYVVRFVRPFSATVGDMTLKTFTANADSADLAKLVVITDLDNKVVYEKGAYTQYGKDTYKLDQAGVQFGYAINPDASFGGNLTKEGESTIKWYNDGADLQKDKTTASVVTITIPEIATIEEKGVITVLSTENSKK